MGVLVDHSTDVGDLAKECQREGGEVEPKESRDRLFMLDTPSLSVR